MKKKLLLLCMGLGFLVPLIASAGDGVVSTNIVGYNKTKIPTSNSYTILSPNFVSVLSDDQTFTLDRVTGNFSAWVDTIAFLSPNGRFSAPFVWYDAGDQGLNSKAGWYNGDDYYIGDTNLFAGTSVLITAMESVDIMVSGQVETEDIVISLDKSGYYFIGNNTAVPLALEKITFTGLEGWVDTLALLYSNGKYSAPFVWYDAGDISVTSKAGWYDSLDNYVGASEILQPGQGVLLTTWAEGATITIPAPVIN